MIWNMPMARNMPMICDPGSVHHQHLILTRRKENESMINIPAAQTKILNR